MATRSIRVTTGGPIGEGLGAFGTRTALGSLGDNNLYGVDLLDGEGHVDVSVGCPDRAGAHGRRRAMSTSSTRPET